MESAQVAPSSIGNAAQIEYWNGRTGSRWAEMQQRIDALFAPLTQAAVDFAAPAGSERVLDIGCGCGASLLAIADRLGPDGSVLGVDISRVMLDVAAARTAHDRRLRVREADASAYPFEAGAFGLLFSRFGVMFFEDPAAAFAHLRGTLARGGRLAFVTWRPMTENPWFEVPLMAVAPLFPDRAQADPLAPGPFAFADPGRVRHVLGRAGFSDIQIVPHETDMRLSGAGELTQAASFLARIGPAAGLLAEADDAITRAGAEAIQAALAQYDTPAGLSLPARVWLVSARA